MGDGSTPAAGSGHGPARQPGGPAVSGRAPAREVAASALHGAAGVCAVLLTRRAARDEPGLGPRLAVWGLVAASATFNASHAPHRPGAPEAFAMMPVVAAVLFEFTLRELRE